MLKLINNLQAFFEDNYTRIHVRAYAKQINITPPTASKLLEEYFSEGLLKKEVDKQYNYYFANKESALFKDLQRTYWRAKLEPLINHINNNTITPIIILFGSTAKGELHKESDIDIAIITPTKKEIDFISIETIIQRRIQAFTFSKLEDIPKELQNNILNGQIIGGMW
jgi:predicted nucleotidyltransferase